MIKIFARYFLSGLVLLFAFSCRKADTNMTKEKVAENRINEYWTELSKIPTEWPAPTNPLPSVYRVLRLDLTAFRAQLAVAGKDKGTETQILFPLPEQKLEIYKVSELGNIPPHLTKMHPEIKAYNGKGANKDAGSVRFELTSDGLTGVITQPGKRIIIEPYTKGDSVHYITYSRNMRDVKRNLPPGANKPVPIPEPTRQ